MSTLNEASPEELIRILTSNLFTLVSSNADTRLQIHERLLNVSPSLYSVCEKKWMEQNRKEYKFMEFNENEDDDADIFVEVTKEMLICFVSWAYIGEYTTEAAGISSYVAESAPITRKKKDRKKVGRVSVWDGEMVVEHQDPQLEEQSLGIAFNSLDIPIEAWPGGDVTSQAGESEGPNALDKTINIGGEPENKKKAIHPLLLNVQIYTFANIYLIEPLKVVSKGKIIDYLSKVEKSPMNFTEPIFDTLEYALLNLPDNDALLDWLARYSSWKLGDLRSSNRLDNLLGIGNGKFAVLLVRHIGPSQINPFGNNNDNGLVGF